MYQGVSFSVDEVLREVRCLFSSLLTRAEFPIAQSGGSVLRKGGGLIL